jgi:hypothetical protein
MRHALARFILVLPFLAFTACDSGDADDDATDDLPDPVQCGDNVTVSARVDGAPFCSLPGFTGTNYDLDGDRLFIQAGAGRTLITFTLSSFAVGTYDLADAQSSASAGYTTASNPEYAIETGTLRITAFSDERVVGTFGFVAVDDGGAEVVVTDGVFDLLLPDAP